MTAINLCHLVNFVNVQGKFFENAVSLASYSSRMGMLVHVLISDIVYGRVL